MHEFDPPKHSADLRQLWFIPHSKHHDCWSDRPRMSLGLFYWHGLTSIPARISKHVSGKVWDEIIYPLLNFYGATVEV